MIARNFRCSKKHYDSIITPDISDYIKNNCKNQSDNQLSKKLCLNQHLITGYRMDILRIRKKRYVPKSKANLELMFNARIEIDALIRFNYKGSMSDTVKQRVKFLESILNHGTDQK